MKVFGYDINNPKAAKPLSLSQVSIVLSNKELANLIALLQGVQRNLGQGKPVSGHFNGEPGDYPGIWQQN